MQLTNVEMMPQVNKNAERWTRDVLFCVDINERYFPAAKLPIELCSVETDSSLHTRR